MHIVDVDYECAWFFLVDVVVIAGRRRRRRRRSARRDDDDDDGDGDDDEADVRDRDRVVDARDARGDASRRRAREGDVPRTVHGRARDEDAGDVR